MENTLDSEIENSVKAAKLEYEKEPMKDFYKNKIAGYHSRLRVKKLLMEIGDIRGKRVLDIGCEAGYVAFKLLAKHPKEFYGIDIVDEALKEFKRKIEKVKEKRKIDTKIVLKKAFLQKMPFKEDFFEIIVCTEVIEHAPNIDKGFKEMSRVLKKGGKLFLTFPNEKLRKKVYPLVKILGVNTDIEKEVTLFDYDPKYILGLL